MLSMGLEVRVVYGGVTVEGAEGGGDSYELVRE
jgi:hypothetical protein